jgi:hypothetical protein
MPAILSGLALTLMSAMPVNEDICCFWVAPIMAILKRAPLEKAEDSTDLYMASVRVRCVPLVAAATTPPLKPPLEPPVPREVFDVAQASTPAVVRAEVAATS